MISINNMIYFVSAVETGSFTETAKLHFTSQQAVSEQVRRLEKHYDTPLLRRGPTLTPTEAGKLVYENASQILAILARTEEDIETLKNGEKQRLTITTGMASTPRFLPIMVAAYQQENPSTVISIQLPNTQEKERSYLPDDCDILIGNLPFSSDLNTIELFQDPGCILVSKKLMEETFGSDFPAVDAALRQGKGYEVFNQIPVSLQQEQQHLRSYFPYNKETSLSSLGSGVIILCEQGLCATLWPQSLAEELYSTRDRMLIYPYLENPFYYRLGLGIRKEDSKKSSIQAFIRFAVKYCRNLYEAN